MSKRDSCLLPFALPLLESHSDRITFRCKLIFALLPFTVILLYTDTWLFLIRVAFTQKDKVKLTGAEIAQLIHSYVDSSALHEDQNISKLIIFLSISEIHVIPWHMYHIKRMGGVSNIKFFSNNVFDKFIAK